MFKKDLIWRLLAAFVLVVLTASVGARSNGGPTVSTDKVDYEPGSIAKITGHGWHPNATVVLQVVHTEGRPNKAYHKPFKVTTDSNGDFNATWYVDPSDSLGASFRLSADSDSAGVSKQHAEWSFIDKTSTTTTVTSTLNPSTFGASVTFNIVVSSAPNTPSPTGTVDLTDGATTLATLTVTAATSTTSTASFTTSTLSVGTHTIAAGYNGDSNYKFSNSSNLSQVVNKATTTTAVVSSQNPSITGANVTFTATVTGTAGATNPSGNVTFKDGATTLGTGALSGGVATFSTTTLSVGSHSITAVYAGDTSYLTSTSSTLTQVVNTPVATSTALSSDTNPANEGAIVTFTATVTGGATPTGTVTFKDGAATIGSGALNGSGVATFASSTLTPGAHSITAVYGGDGTHGGSTSSAVSQSIIGNTTTAVTSGTNPSKIGQSVTFTATITKTSGTPTGTVTFKDGATTLGTGAVSGGTTATFSTSSLSVGTHSITAVYGGDSGYNGSTSSALSQVVNQGATTTVVVSGTNPSIQSQSVLFTATVSVTSPAAGTPTGTVTFKDGAATMGTGTLSGNTATFSTSSLTAGSHTITAVYAGDTNFLTSTSSNLTQVVNSNSTTTAVVSNHNPSVFGQSDTFTATVTTSTGTATGTVTFMDGATTLGTGTLAANVATFSTAALSVGTHSITAVYGGDSTYTGSTSSVLSQVVNKASTTTGVATSGTPTFTGQNVTFTATIAVTSPGAGSPSGTVNFKDGAAVIGTGTISGTTATFSTTSLTAGSHTISAVYVGDSSFNTSTSSNITQVVNNGTTTTTVVSGTNPSKFGQSVTFTATVSTSTGTATGTVTFMDGATTLGTGTLAANVATFSTAGLSVGTHSITAVYGGDSNYAGSTSSVLSQVVNQGATTTTVGTSGTPVFVGTNVTFTATVAVTAPAVGSETGTVTFKDGATTLGTGTLSGNTATFSTSSLIAGSHSITAVYGGDTNFATSTSSALTQVVNSTSTTTTVTSNHAPAVFGQNVTLTATITVSTGSATGTITFMDGATTLGTGTVSGNLATYSSSTLAVGTHSITAIYSGDSTYGGSTSATFSQVVNKGSTTTTVTSDGTPSFAGDLVTFTATVSVTAPAVGTPTGTVTFKDGAVTLGTGTLSGSTATFATAALTIGSHTISAVYAGDTNFNTSTSANFTQVVDDTTSHITFSSSLNPSTWGASVTFSGRVTDAGGTKIGNALVQFYDNGVLIGSDNTNNGGNYSFAISTLSVGSHPIVAHYVGNLPANAPVDSTTIIQVVNKATATVTLGSLTQTYNGTPRSATATTVPAGLTVTFTYNGSATAPTNAGTYAVVATVNDTNYQGTASGTLTINKATATMALSNLTQTYDGTPKSATVTTTPLGLSGVSITYDGSSTAPTNAGTYAVVATLTNQNYTATNATGTLTINKATATLSLTGLSATYDGTSKSVTVSTNPASLTTVAVTYDGSATAPTNAGSYAVVATLTNANYQATDVTGTLVIDKADQTITFGALPTHKFGDVDATLTATSSAGIPVTFAANAPVTITGNTMSFPANGGTSVMITVTASAVGDANHNAAPDATQSFTLLENVKPTSTAALQPPPNANGWNKTMVTVGILATDNVGGDGIKEIHYTVDGGADVGVPGDSASFDVSAEGTHTVQYRAVDNADNVEDWNTITFKIDSIAPTITATPDRAPDSNGWYTSPLDITFTADDEVGGSGLDPTTLTPPAHYDGPDSKVAFVSADAKDFAGNQAHTVFNFKYDATNPVILVTGLTGSVHESVVFDVSASDNGSGSDLTLTTTLKKNGVVVWTWTGTDVAPAAPEQSISGAANDGSYHLDVTATDEAGHQSTASYDFIIDNQAPVITFLPSSPDDGGFYNTAQTIAYTITSPAGLASTIETLLTKIASVDIGPSPITSPTTVSQEGVYTVHLGATDNLGHTAQLDRTFTIDLTAPTVNDAQVSGQLAPNPLWFESDVSVTLSADDPQIRTTPTAIDGSGTAAVYYYATGAQTIGSAASPIVASGTTTNFTINVEGITTITYWAVDNAGNVAASRTVTVQYDKTKPSFPSISDITTVATSEAGAVVTFTLPTPTDNVDTNPKIHANPASGSTFPVGTTTVFVTATDDAGQTFGRIFGVTVTNPVPVLNSLSPNTKQFGDPGFNMTITGNKFMIDSIVRIDGVDLPTTWNSFTELLVPIPSSYMTTSGTKNITVFTPSPDGGTSNSLPFTVTKADQTIDFPAITGKTYGDAPFDVNPTVPSGLPVTVVVTSGPATIAGNTITITGAGLVTLTASQAGDANHNAAPDKVVTFTVAKADPTVTAVGGLFPYDGNPHAGSGSVKGVFNEDLGAVTISYTPGGATVPVSGGTYTVTASFAGDSNYNAATGTATLTIGKGDQTIDFPQIPDKVYGDAPFALSATASSGLPVSFSIVSGPVTLSSGTLTITGVGSVTIRAKQAGNANYNAAPDVDVTFNVGKATPTITVNGGTFTYDGNPHPATGTVKGVGGVDLGALTFSYNPGGTAPINVGNYNATGSFAGDATYNAVSGTAAIHINQATATITLGSLTATYTGTPHSVTATTSPAGLSGVTVLYDGSAAPPTAAGSYAITASLSNTNYQATTATGTLVISKANPTVSVSNTTYPYDGNPHAATGTATGVLGEDLGALSFTYTPGGSSAPVNGGTYSVTGSFAGNTNYNSGTGTGSVTISVTAATLNLGGLSQTYTGSGINASVTTTPPGLSGVSITYNGSATLPVNAGSYSVVATLSNPSYTASPVSGTLVIGKANATLVVTPVTTTFNGATHPTTGTATGVLAESLGALTMSYTPGPGAPTNAGSYTATGSFAGTANYNAGTANATITINKAAQTITFAGPGNQTYGVAPITLTGSASSGLGLTFSVVSGPASIAGSTLTITGAGSVVLQAAQAGNGNYNAATNVQVTITVAKATPTIIVTGGTFAFDSNPHPATGSVTGVGGANLGTPTFTYTPGGATPPTAAGTYSVTGNYAGNANYNAVSGSATIIISGANATMTLSNLSQTYTGNGITATVTTNPSGLSGVSVTYNGSATLPINVGSYAVVATLNNASFAANPVSGTLVITKADPLITVNPLQVQYDGNPHGTTGTVKGVQGEDLGALPITYTPGTVAPTNVGIYTATGTYTASANYNGGTSSVIVEIDQATQTITFPNPGNQTYGVAPITLGASSSAGLPITFSIVSGPATVSGTTMTITGAGTVVIKAANAGTTNVSPASATVSIAVAKATPTLVVTGGTFSYDGNPHPATGSVTGVGGANLGSPTFTYTPGGATAPTAIGTYSVTGAFAGNANYLAASKNASITINGNNATMTLSNLTQTYTGSGISATVTTNPAGLSGVSVTYNGSATLPINVGTYAVVASLNNVGYSASPVSGTLTITKATPTITMNPITVVYDSLPHPITATATGAAGENLTPVIITYPSADNTPPETIGTYTVTAKIVGSANYVGATTTATITITPKALTVTANNLTKFVDGPNPTLTGVVTGGIPSDGIGGVFSLSGQQALTAGQYTITAGVSDPNGAIHNYTVTKVNGVLRVIYNGNTGPMLPIKADGTSVFAKGAIVPIRFNVFNVNGSPVSYLGVVQSFTLIQTITGAGPLNSTGVTATPSTVFKWDGTSWVYYLDTSTLTANFTYVYRISLNDGTFITVKFGVR